MYWNAVVQSGTLPSQRWASWEERRRIEKTGMAYLQHLNDLKNSQILYGFPVKRELVKDSVMVSIRFTSPTYPTTREIYRHIDILLQHIAAQGDRATNHPMLHVQPAENGYLAQVAVPTSRLLPDSGSILRKRMVLGNILMAEIKGGQARVEAALQQLDNYAKDHELRSPAIPYASLVTDRTKVPDSTQWITRIYYPVY